MICNHLVVGLHDASVSLKLQMDPDLTLKKAVIAASQSETIKKQQSVVRPSDHSPNIDRQGHHLIAAKIVQHEM